MRFCIWLLSLLSLSQVEAQKGLEFPVHDGRERLINLKKKNFDRFVKKYDILVVYFYAPPKDEGEERNWELTKQMLELAAQITEREGIAFGVVDLTHDKKLSAKLGIFEIGAIYCYYKNEQIEYNGQRSTDVLIEFLLELDEFPVEDINTKVEVAAFKRNDELPRVVGYFDTKKSINYDEFVDASAEFQPLIPFYAVFNWQLAKALGFKEVGEIRMFESFSSTAKLMSGDGPHDNIDIEAFVEDNKRSTLRKLSRLNMYEVWEDDINDIHIVAFADDEDPEGFELVQTLKELAHLQDNNDVLSLVWIDPDEFPLMHEYWERQFGLDLKEPNIGVVNVTDADSVWMDLRQTRAPTLDELDKWISDVLEGRISTEADDGDYELTDDDDSEDNIDDDDQVDEDGDEDDDNDDDADDDDDDDDDDEIDEEEEENDNNGDSSIDDEAKDEL